MSDTRFVFLEGNPAWLDFVNTRFVLGDALVDRLEGYPDLVDWLKEASLLESGKAEAAARSWNGREALEEARKLRESLHDAAGALARNASFPAATVRLLNALLAAAPGTYQLTPSEGGLQLGYGSAPKNALQLLEPLARSTAQFLSSADLRRVRKCSNEHCVLYFYDGTKNQARRWCSMAQCGNRMKAAAHYQRRKERENR